MRLIVAALVACACLAAPKGPSSWPIEKIEIEGLHAYTREQVLPVLGLKTGQHASEKDFNAARDRLLASGAFESAGYRYAPAPSKKGYLVTFQVVEAAPRFPVRFEDLPADELNAALKRSDPFFGPEIPATQPLLDRYTKTVEEYLAAHGRTGKITGRVEPEDNGTLVVMFRPAGARPVVAGVKFTGNVVVPSTALENAINAVAIGVPYKESRFRRLLDTLVRPLYDARGRVRVAFPEIGTAPDPSVRGLVVTVKVDEGASYAMGGLEIAGTGLGAADLRKLAAACKPGDVFTSQAVEAAASKAEGRMKQAGYLRAKSVIDRQIDDKAHKVDVAIRVEPGARYTFGKLTIDGLDILTEPAIRKMWGLKPGEPFNAEYPEYFLAHVREEGIFDNLGETKSTIAPDDENRTVDVKLSFKGEPPKPKKRDEPERGRARPDTMPGP